MNDKVFVIGIELNTKAAYAKFESINFGYGTPVLIVPGLYCIKVPYSYTSLQIRDYIVNMFQEKCQVFVMKSNIDLSWRLPDSIALWLKENI